MKGGTNRMASQDRAKKLDELRKRMGKLAGSQEIRSPTTTEMAKPATTSTEIQDSIPESEEEFEEVEEEEELPYAESPQYPTTPKPIARQPQRRMPQNAQQMSQFQPRMPPQRQIPAEEEYYASPQIHTSGFMQDNEAQQKAEQARFMQAEIERLQNDGSFRIELLYQLLQMNKHLGRIVSSLSILAGG